MKKLFSLLMFISPFVGFAEETNHHEIQMIYQKNYLEAEDNLDTIYFLAQKVIHEAELNMSPTELVKRFKELALNPDIQERYLAIYADYFDEEESKEVCELIQNELYLKHREAVGEANWTCHQETINILEDLVQKIEISPIEKPAPEIIHLTEANLQELLLSPQPLIIDAYADWCGPCKMLAPIFKELNEEYGHLYQFVKLDVDTEPGVAHFFHITAMPTIIFMKEGKEVGRHVGFMNKDKFTNKIKSTLEKP